MVNSIHHTIVTAGALIPGALLCAWQKLHCKLALETTATLGILCYAD
jgi:hypothetical protein